MQRCVFTVLDKRAFFFALAFNFSVHILFLFCDAVLPLFFGATYYIFFYGMKKRYRYVWVQRRLRTIF